MRFTRLGSTLLLCAAMGCSDPAYIGGLCPLACGLASCERTCQPSQCSGGTCTLDASLDACTGTGCTIEAGQNDEQDAGPMCGEGSYALTRKRLDLILVIDDSSSLAPWLGTLHDGLDQFLRQDLPIGIGLQRFDEVCDASTYRQLIVPIAPLPQNAAALMQAAALMPTISTSTIPALDGVLQQARAWALAHDVHVAVVLLTDASPGACDGLVGDYDTEAQRIARAGFEGTPSIKTYAIAFSTLSSAAAIATAGGTQVAQISVTPADGDVLAALNNVVSKELPCEFQPPSGWTPTPSSAVTFSAPDGSQRRIPILRDASACNQQPGFYADDTTAPFVLHACPSICESLSGTNSLTSSEACATSK